MEANEGMRRIFWRHRWLLLVLTVLPVALLAPYLLTRPVTYAASASLQAQSAEPQADTQVTAILSQVTAVATSPALVQAAINSAGVGADPLTVARHDITVTSLGTSAVVTLTVTSPNPQVAIRLSGALAGRIVSKLNGLGTQTSQELASLTTQRNQLNQSKARLLKQLATTRLPGTSAGVQALIAQLTSIGNQLTANSAAVQQVLASSTVNEGAGVISAPSYAISQSRHVASYCALAGLLGLVIGLLIATIRELARPTLAEPGAAARELSLVLLGDAQVTRDNAATADLELATRLDLAAHRLGARTLVLTGPVPPAQLSALAACLNQGMHAVTESLDGAGTSVREGARIPGITPLAAHHPAADGKTSSGPLGTVSPHLLAASSARTGLTVAALPDLTLRGRPDEPALVLVLSRFAPRAALDEAVDLGVTTGWPLLGVIGVSQRRGRRRQAAPAALPPAGSGTALAEEELAAEEEAADIADGAAAGQTGFADGEAADDSTDDEGSGGPGPRPADAADGEKTQQLGAVL